MKPVHPLEEALYERIAAEIAAGEIKKGLWLKATVDSGGNENAAKALYAKFRFAQLMEEVELQQKQAATASEGQRRAELALLVDDLGKKNYAVEEKVDGHFVLIDPSGECRRLESYADFAMYAKELLKNRA